MWVVHSSKKEIRRDNNFQVCERFLREGGNKVFSRQFSISVASMARNDGPPLQQESEMVGKGEV